MGNHAFRGYRLGTELLTARHVRNQKRNCPTPRTPPTPRRVKTSLSLANSSCHCSSNTATNFTNFPTRRREILIRRFQIFPGSHLRQHDDLAHVHREVLDRVEDCLQSRHLLASNLPPPEQLFRADVG